MDKHAKAFVESHCQDGEEVKDWVSVQRDGDALMGAMVLTDRRVAYIRKGMLADKFEPWPLSRITSVETRKGIVFYEFELHTSGDDLKVRTAEKDNAARFVGALQDALSAAIAPATSAAPPPAPVSDDPMAQLEKLGKLRDAGVIDADEFAAKKAELLARI